MITVTVEVPAVCRLYLGTKQTLLHFLLTWALCGGNWLIPSWRSPCSEVMMLGQKPAPPLLTAPSHRSCCVNPALQGHTMSCDRRQHSLSSESHPHNTLESPENFRKMPDVIGSGGFFVYEKPLTLMGQPIFLLTLELLWWDDIFMFDDQGCYQRPFSFL